MILWIINLFISYSFLRNVKPTRVYQVSIPKATLSCIFFYRRQSVAKAFRCPFSGPVRVLSPVFSPHLLLFSFFASGFCINFCVIKYCVLILRTCGWGRGNSKEVEPNGFVQSRILSVASQITNSWGPWELAYNASYCILK